MYSEEVCASVFCHCSRVSCDLKCVIVLVVVFIMLVYVQLFNVRQPGGGCCSYSIGREYIVTHDVITRMSNHC